MNELRIAIAGLDASQFRLITILERINSEITELRDRVERLEQVSENQR